MYRRRNVDPRNKRYTPLYVTRWQGSDLRFSLTDVGRASSVRGERADLRTSLKLMGVEHGLCVRTSDRPLRTAPPALHSKWKSSQPCTADPPETLRQF